MHTDICTYRHVNGMLSHIAKDYDLRELQATILNKLHTSRCFSCRISYLLHLFVIKVKVSAAKMSDARFNITKLQIC